MAGVKAASGTGRLPLAWFESVCESSTQAEEAQFESNAARMAKRIWGNK